MSKTEKIKYSDFFNKSKKGIDSWTEIFVFDVISPPFGFLLYKLFGNFKSLPYWLTLSHFILKMSSAYCFLIGNWILAPILFFVASMIDNVDGKISRFINGKDPDSRGTLDYLFDCTALFAIYFGMIFNLISNGLIVPAYFVISAALLLGLFFAYGSAKFRLYGIKKYDPNQNMSEINKGLSKGWLMKILFSLQKVAKKLRISFYPTMVEAEMLIIIVYPFFSSLWILALANLIIIVDAVASGLMQVILMLRGKL